MERSSLDRSGESLLAHAAKLRRLAAHLVTDSATADDLVQDTFVAALHAAPSDDRPLEPWLSRVVRNFAKKAKRAKLRREDRERDLAPLDHVPTPAAIAERLEVQRVLLETLGSIDDPFRTTLVLRYFEDLSSSEIARLQKVPAATVRWRHQRGLELLREKLDQRFRGSRATWCALVLPLARPHLASMAAASTAATQGVLAMSAVTKIVGALAVTAVAGVLWWKLDGSNELAAPAAAHASEAAPSPQIAPATTISARTPEVAESREPAKADAPAVAAPAAPIAAKPLEALTHLVADAHFVDVSGAPCRGVELTVNGESPRASAKSGGDGRATLEFDARLFNGTPRHFSFVASHPSYATVALGATMHAGEDAHLGDVVMQPAITLHGRVVDEHGKGIEGARVGIGDVKFDDDDLERGHRFGMQSFGQRATTTSAADGVFALDGVGAGAWRLWGKSTSSRFNWSEPLEVRGDRDLYDLELVLSPIRDTDRLAGLVVDPSGAPVPGANLTFYYQTQGESGSTSHVADQDGRFDFLIQRDTDYTIVATDPLHRWADSALEKVAPGSVALQLRLGEPLKADVAVHDADGKPIEHADLVVTRSEPSMDTDSVEESIAPGHFRIAVPNYPFELTCKSIGFRTQRLDSLMRSSLPSTIEFTLQRLPVIRGRVTADGEPVAGARVGLYPRVDSLMLVNDFLCVVDSYTSASVSTHADGTYEIGCELAGKFIVRAEANGWAAAESDSMSAPANSVDLNFELTHGGALEGRVVFADGRNPEGAIVGINHGDGRARTQRAGPNGRYHFEGLTPGKWQVLLRTSEVSPDSTTVSTRQGEPQHDLDWSCDVIAGKTSYFDLDVPNK